MTVNSHIDALRQKHQTLSEAVETAARKPGVSSLEIAQLKKQKLQLKEEITRLTT